MPHRSTGSPPSQALPLQMQELSAIKEEHHPQDNTKMIEAATTGHHRHGSHGSHGSGATRVDAAADDEAQICEEEGDEVSAGEGSTGAEAVAAASSSTETAAQSAYASNLDSSNPARRPRRRPRRSTGELELNERWICPKGCGKIYRKNSTVSIRKHVPYCVGPVATPPTYSLADPMQMMYSQQQSYEQPAVVPGSGSAPNSPPLHYAASLPPRALTSPEQHQHLLTQHYMAQSSTQPQQQAQQQAQQPQCSQPPSPQHMPMVITQQQQPQPMMTQSYAPVSPPSPSSLMEMQHHQAQMMQQQQQMALMQQRQQREHADHMRAMHAQQLAQMQMQNMQMHHQLQHENGAKMLSHMHTSTLAAAPSMPLSSTPLSRVISPLSLVKLAVPTTATRLSMPHSAFKAVVRMAPAPVLSCKEEAAAAAGYAAPQGYGAMQLVGGACPAPQMSTIMPSSLHMPLHHAQYHSMNGALRRIF